MTGLLRSGGANGAFRFLTRTATPRASPPADTPCGRRIVTHALGTFSERFFAHRGLLASAWALGQLVARRNAMRTRLTRVPALRLTHQSRACSSSVGRNRNSAGRRATAMLPLLARKLRSRPYCTCSNRLPPTSFPSPLVGRAGLTAGTPPLPRIGPRMVPPQTLAGTGPRRTRVAFAPWVLRTLGR